MKNKKSLFILCVIMVSVFALAACAPAASGQVSESPAATQPAASSGEPSTAPSEEPSAEPSEQPSETPAASAGAPADPADTASVTLTTLGEITEILDDGDQIHVLGENDANPANDIIANIADDTVIIDAQTGAIIDDDNAFNVGDTVYVTVSSAMTRSIPPISNALMAVVNIPENMLGIPEYLIAEEVEVNDDGSVTILNQNKDIYITIPSGLEIEAMEPDGDKENIKVAASDLKKGDTLIVYYDAVAMSYPAQTTATRAILIVD